MTSRTAIAAGLVIVSILTLVSQACTYRANAEQPGKLSAGVAEREALLALDFSSELASRPCYTFDDVAGGSYDGPGSAYLRATLGTIGSHIPDRDLTPAELKRLGVWETGDGRMVNVHTMQMYLRSYYIENGKLPESGADYYPELLTPSGYSEYMAVSTTDRLAKCFPMVNTITGKLYRTFQATEWCPGGINIEIIDDPATISRDYADYTVPLDPLNLSGEYRSASSVWAVTVYGEAPDTVLWKWEWAY